jgi:hypothetical protein
MFISQFIWLVTYKYDLLLERISVLFKERYGICIMYHKAYLLYPRHTKPHSPEKATNLLQVFDKVFVVGLCAGLVFSKGTLIKAYFGFAGGLCAGS